MEKGLILKSTGSWYKVKTDGGDFVDCKIRGKLRLKGLRTTNPVSVGDVVWIDKEEDGSGIIAKIEARKNYIIRKSINLSKESHIIAANIDQVFLVLSLVNPETPLEFIDRFLVAAEAYSIPAILVFNKKDLYDEPTLEYMNILEYIYKQIGYRTLAISAKMGENISDLLKLLPGKINLFAGNSGVGKSTLLNLINPNLGLKTAEISESHKTGKHTTTFSEMFEINGGGYLIDTPGIRGFGLIDFDKEELSHYFPEIFKYSEHCQFYNCTHTHEPNCAVKKAVEEVNIAESRYQSYLNILNDQNEKYRQKF